MTRRNPFIRVETSERFRRGMRGQHEQSNFGVDVLPPELMPHFDALNPDATVEHSVQETTPVDMPQCYGFLSVSPFVTSATIGESLQLLQQPETQRIHLFIQNRHGASTMVILFGTQAGTGINLLAGQSIFYDAFVPQDDIWIQGTGASLPGTIAYSNKKI